MKAIVLDHPAPLERHPLRVAEVAAPKPGPGELLVRVAACGVCRSNLHMIEGDWVRRGVPGKTPIVPGHEIAGTVAELGANVVGWKRGDRVGVQPLWSTCLRCAFCLTGREQLCPYKEITGESVDGGYAELVVARAEHAYPIPEGLDLAAAAPLFCPGITAYGAVAKARVAPGKRVAVFGVGGVGHIAIELARLAGGDVVAVARSAKHLELAEELGADECVDASRVDPVERIASSGGADATIVFAPSSAVLRQAIAATKPGGVVVVGVFADPGELSFVEEKTIVGSLLGSRQEMREVLALAAAGKIRAHCETFPLDRAADALDRLRRGEIRARAVLVA